MSHVVDIEQAILAKLKTLSPKQQQEVLDFVEFLQTKSPQPEFKHPDGTPMSALEAAREWAGCLDGGPGDLSTNKKYLKGLGTA